MVGEGNQAYVDGRVQDAIRVIRIESRAISACAVLANRQALHAHSDGADFPDELEGNTRNIFQPVSQTSRMEESDVRFPFCFSFPFFSTHPSSDTRVCERNSYPPPHRNILMGTPPWSHYAFFEIRLILDIFHRVSVVILHRI